ncbi:MAG: hypothetical protein JWN76_2460 [Chitinophagaceae bacterium]|nr:hypothetical protein [Chitinophagaceae bacterium]
MDSRLIETFSTIIATVIGTILGWLLNNLSKKGKLKIIDREVRIDPVNKSHMGSAAYNYDFTLWFYNSSNDFISIHDFMVESLVQGEKLTTKCFINSQDKTTHLNFIPKQITVISFNALQAYQKSILAGDVHILRFGYITTGEKAKFYQIYRSINHKVSKTRKQ